MCFLAVGLCCARGQWRVTTQIKVVRGSHKNPVATDKTITEKNPLHLMQNVSGETFDAVSVRKSLSKLSDFQSVTASPYRVLHQAQGDKQEINLSSVTEVKLAQ